MDTIIHPMYTASIKDIISILTTTPTRFIIQEFLLCHPKTMRSGQLTLAVIISSNKLLSTILNTADLVDKQDNTDTTTAIMMAIVKMEVPRAGRATAEPTAHPPIVLHQAAQDRASLVRAATDILHDNHQMSKCFSIL